MTKACCAIGLALALSTTAEAQSARTTNLVYDEPHQWSAYDVTNAQKLSGVLKQIKFNETMPTMTLDVEGKPLLIVLAPAPRMEFRDLTEDMLKPGMTLTVVAYRSKARSGEFRAQSVTVGRQTFDMR